ncbi:hypothetical protein B0O80DRAFT_436981 [Mortierella sp. GBAus27b]|nr:hypothetical protein B0O80DRAFT_436981 [Mortierella sp. GBAus27b]
MGKTPKTRMDEDFNTLQTETEARRVTLEKLVNTSQGYLKAISKRIEGDDKHKGLAVEMFGMSMSSQGHALHEGSVYREALIRMGEAHQSIGVAQNELINQFRNSIVDSLEKEQVQMKEYLALQKKLHSRRLDYDAKLSKVQKAKKEKPEWEEEMQAAKSKYEDTRECIVGIMTTMNDSQEDSVRGLKAYYNAQLAFARKIVEVLEGIPESTFAISENGSQSSPQAAQPRRICRQSSDEDQSINSDDHSSTQSISTASGRHPLDRASTISDFGIGHARKGSAGGIKMNGHAPPPALPTRKKQQKQVRALYNFEATADGELSLQKGDVVRIIEEIDEGWWEGEIVDSKGVRHEGMFPSNYVEEVNGVAVPGRRQDSISSNGSDPKYKDEDEVAYYTREPELLMEEPLQTSVVSQSTLSRQPAQTANLAHSPTPARSTTPLTRPASGILSKPVGSRAAPPPPCRTIRHSATFNHPSVPGESTSPPAPSTPSGYISRDYFASQVDPVDSAKGPCRECQCAEFRSNVFKRGSCNNCFHAH